MIMKLQRAHISLMLIVTMAMACIMPAVAQEVDDKPVRPVASMFTADVGHASLLDSYVSPITYGGLAMRLGYEAQQATGFAPTKWTRQLDLGVSYDNTHNPAGNHTMHSLMVDAKWGMMYRWRDVLTPNLQFMLGGSTQLVGGMLYNAHNSNNVVSVRAHWSIGAMGQAVYNTHISRLPITLRYQATLPVAGVFFSPDYDEAYYEIYLGNHDNLAHFGWWGNRFDMENLVSADLHLGTTLLRVGYRNRITTSWCNGINVRDVSHCFVIGIGGEFLSVGRKQRNENIASSIYK